MSEDCINFQVFFFFKQIMSYFQSEKKGSSLEGAQCGQEEGKVHWTLSSAFSLLNIFSNFSL